MDHLSALEQESLYILREAHSKIPRLSMLWSMGKDSTALLWLTRKAFLGAVPYPLIHIDTSYKIPEMIEYRITVEVVGQKETTIGRIRERISGR